MKAITPNLAVVGAMKAGTTSLHAALDLHPSIFMSNPVKEATYFFPEDKMRKRLRAYGFETVETRAELLERYMSAGYAGQRYFGESPTDYSLSDNARRFEIAKRMKTESPDIRILYIVRNPYSRILSGISHRLNDRQSAVHTDLNGSNRLGWPAHVGPSRYHYHISAYYDYFDPSQIMIVSFEDFIRDQNDVMQTVFRFLDIEEHPIKAPQRRNASLEDKKGKKAKLPRSYVERIRDIIDEEMAAFQELTRFPTDQWDLDPENWIETER